MMRVKNNVFFEKAFCDQKTVRKQFLLHGDVHIWIILGEVY